MNTKTINNLTMLLILDGFGYRKETVGNAIKTAKMPFFKKLLKDYPVSLLNASGEAVGLLPGYIGNSEVGHLTIGAGRIIKSNLTKFKESIDNGELFKNRLLIESLQKLKTNKNSLHIMGLLSDGGVHSHQFQLDALLELAKKQNLKNVYLHIFLDGRDVPPKSAKSYLKKLKNKINKIGIGTIASIHGRFYAMDRDNNWERTKKSYAVLCDPETTITENKWEKIINKSYNNQITDEFLIPTLLIKDGQIKKNDGIIFFNFRPDRARQLTESFINPNFNRFKTQNLNSTNNTLSFFITTTRYNDKFKNFNNGIIFKKEKIENTLLDQIPYEKFIIAETEKYAHVTYFFRGMVEKKLPNEKQILIPSIKAKNYIEHPEMSAQKITDKVLESLKTNPSTFYLINYANADMVGHSGDFNATVKACECLDIQIKMLYKEIVENQNGTIFLTADHGNAEEMINIKTGEPKTSHTINPVYFLTINKESKLKKIKKSLNVIDLCKKKNKLGLRTIAPIILEHLKLEIPIDMKKNKTKR